MSFLKNATVSLRYVTCNLYGHMAKESDLKKLIDEKLPHVDGVCCKCESPIRIILDWKNPSKYVILER